MQLSIVVPCYNEQDCLHELHRRVTAAARDVAGDDYELILVNDASRDRTWATIQALCAADPRVVGIDLSRNHGHQLALTAGLSLAGGDHILIIDADLQDPPELLAPMLEMLRLEGADVVYGQRRSRSGETRFKKMSAALFYRLLNRIAEVDIPVDTGDFRLMTRRALNTLLAMPERHRFIRGMVAWIGFRQVPFLYDRDARFAGQTNYPLRKMIKLTLDATTGFSIAPLRLASHLGLGLAAASLLLLGYIVIAWLGGRTITGWASLMCVVVTLGAVQMLLIGLVGEYLGRLYMEAKGRPLFVIKDVVTLSSARVAETTPLGFALERASATSPSRPQATAPGVATSGR